MKKEQTINLEEEMTVVGQQAESMPETKKIGAWKSVIIGGVPGIILGTAGTAFAQEVMNANNQEEETGEAEENTSVDNIVPQTLGVEMAESVNDDMSFGEAFAAAREEVGPGGVFEWHGNLYNTYSAAEWEAMSDEDRQEFANSVYNAQNNEDKPEDGEQGQEPTDVVANNDGEGSAEQEPAELANSDTASEGESSGEVHDVQIHEVGSLVTDDGEVLNVAVASVDGHDAAFVDEDNDGYVDSVLVDTNDDGVIENDEVIDMSDSDVSMADLAMLAGGPEDSMYEGTPDYTNDADTSSLA